MGLKRRNPARTRLLAEPEARGAAASFEAPTTSEPIAPRAPAAARPPITREERHQRIARAAYGRAERAGFATDPLEAWLAAEREIDAQLARLAS